MSIVVASFYKFVHLPDYRQLRPVLISLCEEQLLRGTLLLAGEGINGTLSGSRAGIDRLADWLRRDRRFDDLEYKESPAPDHPFARMKVRLKKEIVTMGIPETAPERISGVRVGPEAWNALLNDPEVTVIDARNRYECDIGMFKNAVSPDTGMFRQFPDFVTNSLDPDKHRRIAMYCTGGIRCEKASAWMLKLGFQQIYQLNGGILRYLAETGPDNNLWQGECFVFDDRVAINAALQPGVHKMCGGCGRPLSPQDCDTKEYEAGVSCQACYDRLTPERRVNLLQRRRSLSGVS